MSSRIDRRRFLQSTTTTAALGALAAQVQTQQLIAADSKPAGMRFGLVTYQWGKDMDLPTLLDVCEKAKVVGVELRTEHKHGVEPTLTKQQRAEVRKRFENSPVTLIGYGSNAEFHASDPAKVKQNIELAKQYIQLMHDCGGSGVKVKPNGFAKDVPREKTIEQIGKSLNEIAAYGQKYGQKIRLEVHGSGTQELPVIKAIFDVANHPNAYVCWNSNPQDLLGDGLEANFRLVQGRFGDTVHIHELDTDKYPFKQLLSLFKGINYQGWMLLEAASDPKDKVAALIEQRQLFQDMAV